MARAETRIPAEDVWDVDPPPGWEPVAEICRAMFAERNAITEEINSKIVEEISDFDQQTSVISRSDLTWSTGGGVAGFLRGVAECAPAREDNLAFQRLVGRRSAMRMLPLQPLITAYQVGFRELWSTLAERAMDGPASSLLLERGSIVWERLVATTSAVAEGYQQEMARREAFEATATAHFIEALEQDAHHEEAAGLARELGFDPDGPFQVVALGGPIAVRGIARSLTMRVQSKRGSASSTQRGRIAVVITQGVGIDVLDGALDDAPPSAAAGVGGPGTGMEGARLSLVEAERALGVALTRQNVCHFDDEWLLAALMSHRESAERILEAGITVAASKEHLADAVKAFADSGFSVAESARRLHVSPNSLRYRLIRWHELTGWDPWSFDGLSRSVLALGLVDAKRSRDALST